MDLHNKLDYQVPCRPQNESKEYSPLDSRGMFANFDIIEMEQDYWAQKKLSAVYLTTHWEADRSNPYTGYVTLRGLLLEEIEPDVFSRVGSWRKAFRKLYEKPQCKDVGILEYPSTMAGGDIDDI